MATAFSLSKFLSFFLPSNPPPKVPPPPPLSLRNSLPKKHKDSNFSPLVVEEGRSGSLSSELSSVMCPSLAHANTLYFSPYFNVEVTEEDEEEEDRFLNRFERDVLRAGIIPECRRRMFHEDSRDKKKRKIREAALRRRRQKRFWTRPPFEQERESTPDVEANARTEEADDDDNWDLPVGGLPY